GCRDFFVAYAAEAAEVLDLAPASEISVLHGPFSPNDAAYIRARGIKPVINSLQQARFWLDAGGGVCDLMVDTGINRLGIAMDALGDDTIRQLEIDVLVSHLASADEDTPFNTTQHSRWQAARASIAHRRASLANSAGIMLGAQYHGDLTRPGIALYGGIPRPELAGVIRQVAHPTVRIMQVRDVSAGDTIGYNRLWTADRQTRVGVVAIGYADGFLCTWSNKGFMLHDGARLPVVGRVSMDMTLIDLSDTPHLREGDWVEVEYALPEAAVASGLSQYELITILARRFVRGA
ncbi:MAG: alanine racemase, partial [Novosphingobium sp.]